MHRSAQLEVAEAERTKDGEQSSGFGVFETPAALKEKVSESSAVCLLSVVCPASYPLTDCLSLRSSSWSWICEWQEGRRPLPGRGRAEGRRGAPPRKSQMSRWTCSRWPLSSESMLALVIVFDQAELEETRAAKKER